jgi:hypothetical protein
VDISEQQREDAPQLSSNNRMSAGMVVRRRFRSLGFNNAMNVFLTTGTWQELSISGWRSKSVVLNMKMKGDTRAR